MLTCHPEVMASMRDEHLISSLYSEPLSPIEKELLKRWEDALDNKGIDVCDIEPHVAEALASYPPEDLLTEIGDDLFKLCESLRGDNKLKATAILTKLTELEDNVRNQSDHGRSELKEILK